MNETIVVLVNGEVLANGRGATIADQHCNAGQLADGLMPIFKSKMKVAILHGNKPQVGFVLFRSELASHVLHPIPLDVCGADTQGATGYILSQEILNATAKQGLGRNVLCMLTQTLVDPSIQGGETPRSAIGPWYDRNKAEQFRQTRGWEMVEEVGRGYRRAVPAYPARAIVEMETIRNLVADGHIVIAGGGGGVPVILDENGEYTGIEAVIETEQLASLMARQLQARTLLSVIENDNKFTLSGLGTELHTRLTREDLQALLDQGSFRSKSVHRILRAGAEFLAHGGEQMIVTTLKGLPEIYRRASGLWLGSVVDSSPIFAAV